MKKARFSSPMSQRRINLILEITRQGHMVKDVAAQIKMDDSRLSQIMYGHVNPSLTEREKLIKVLGVREGKRKLFDQGGRR